MYVIGLLALSLLITAVIVIGILFLMSGFAYWLAISPSTKVAKIRTLLKPLLKGTNQVLEGTNQDATTDSSNEGREKGEQKHKSLVYRIYPTQSIQKLYPLPKTREWGVNNFTRAGEDMRTDGKEDDGAKYTKTSIEGSIPRGVLHIRNIVASLIARCQLKWKRTLFK